MCSTDPRLLSLPVSPSQDADEQARSAAAAARNRLADDWLAADLAFRLGVLQT